MTQQLILAAQQQTPAIVAELQALISNVLTVNGLKKSAILAARFARDLLPGLSGTTQKAVFAEQWLIAAVEVYDNKIPVFGQFMDLPLVDRLEAAAVRSAIAWGFAAMELEEPVVNAPELPSGADQ
jgi:hypothetical protein